MANQNAKTAPVGSVQWIQNERDQVTQLVHQDVEEFSYSVRNELEWLNEHMQDIFSRNQMSFADMLKTPSRMRGKTPRTARARDALPARQPLTDIFAPTAHPMNAAVQTIDFQSKTVSFPVPSNESSQASQHRPLSRGKSPNRAGIHYTDSGYHGMTEDEMDIDAHTISIEPPPQEQDLSPMVAEHASGTAADTSKEAKADESGTSEESFVSAEEAVFAKATTNPLQNETQETDDATIPDEEIQPVLDEAEDAMAIDGIAPLDPGPTSMDVDNQSQSSLSSPENPLQRKSSFAFSALPPREPLGTKRSIGNRNSQAESVDARTSALSKSVGANNVGLGSEDLEGSHQPKSTESEVRGKTSTQLMQERISMLGKTKEPRPSKRISQNAFSVQPAYPHLPEPEPELESADLPSPQPAHAHNQLEATIADDDEDWIAPTKPTQTTSQSQPLPPSVFPARPSLHQKSISSSNIPSTSIQKVAPALERAKAPSASQPNLADTLQSTTPIGSPLNRRVNEGTISASKNRLWSALKSAKNIFASSASASAAAKLEAHNNSPVAIMSSKRDFSDESKTTAIFKMPGALYSEPQLPKSPSRPISVLSLSPKRTRSSTENDRRREKEAKEQQKAADNLEKARQKERNKVTKQRLEDTSKSEQVRSHDKVQERVPVLVAQNERPPSADDEMPQPSGKTASSFKSSILSSGKLRAPGRPVRPNKGAVQSKPAPVSIRVASQSQRLGQGQTPATSSKSQDENSANTSSAKDHSSSRPGSAQSNKSGPAAPVNARVKALEAAARKKEADEKAAQKKVEQKRELERKRALKAEEEKRAEEERRAAEQQRLQEAKLAAQRKAEKQAEARRREQERVEQQRREQERAEQQRREQERIEQQRREQERIEQQRREQERVEQERRREVERMEQQRREQERLEQLRHQEEARKAREAHELADKIKRERAQQAQQVQQAHSRGDVGGTIRQLIKHTIPQLNPAKPAKRHVQPEDDDTAPPLQRPGIQRGPPSYQQNDAKRRRTNEEQDEPEQRRSVMAPPKRPSNLRKETMSKFPHGYTHAAGTSTAHHGPSMFKAAVAAQHQFHHAAKGTATHPSQMVQISNARIPFAENNNPPASHHASTLQPYPGHENGFPSASTNKFKTPARPGQAPKSAKSSPLYQNGDHITLPEIATDSEDEDSDGDDGTGFRAPSWVASPALRELLTQQQLVDPESVFGPIAELKMDEMFRGAKNPERLKKFRDRGSSALWIESGDAVTSAEKRRDMELRERVAREGGWRYEPGV